jgi:uncharacterized PurR-regulated membrane protein YhhQ (DUF165 family)
LTRTSRTKRIAGFTAIVAFIGTIVVANHLTSRYGFVAVGFGYTATAGTYAAGLAFGLRDAVHEWLGRWGVLAAILVGAFVSWWVAPALAVASGVAFLVSELADFAVYSPLRRRNLYAAVAASNVVGMIADTILFLWIAFGWAAVVASWEGQILGKAWVTLATLMVIAAWRLSRRREAMA